jgi:protein-disulfide isomerase
MNAPLAAPLDKAAVETIIRDYLLANPEVLEEAYQVLQAKRQQAEADAHKAAITERGELIFNSTNQAVLGNPDGAVTLVEFFDYNCGYCRRAVSDMTALLEANPDLRIVIKEFPILSEGSVEAARISVAVKDLQPARYLEFHNELFARPGEATAAKALEVAADLGIDAEALKAAAAKPEVTANITEVHQLATELGISGTPSYVIGNELVPGAVGYDSLQAKVAAVRQCGATVC